MGKKNALDRAIDNIQSQIDVLELAKQKLREQQAKTTVRRPRAVKASEPKSA